MYLSVCGSASCMFARGNIFGRLPLVKKLFVIVGAFVAIVICVFFLGVFRSDILSGVRAYVGGEGLWSKAQKRAVLSLMRYAEAHHESDYQEYLDDIAVPEGDKLARLELEHPKADMDVVWRGFVQGRNSPDDVESMARLFRQFRHVGYMAQAIAIWTEGDEYVDEREMQTHAGILPRRGCMSVAPRRPISSTRRSRGHLSAFSGRRTASAVAGIPSFARRVRYRWSSS